MEKTKVDVEIPVKCSIVRNGFGRVSCFMATILSPLSPLFRIIGTGIAWGFIALAHIVGECFPILFIAFLLGGSFSIVFNPLIPEPPATVMEIIFVKGVGALGLILFSTTTVAHALTKYNVELDIHCIRGE